MTKIMILPTKKNIQDILAYCDSIVLGLQDMCVNMPDTFTIEDIQKLVPICKKMGKQVFVSLNKNMHTKDLNDLKGFLYVLDTLHIDGIFYYDISIAQYKIEMDLTVPLVWSQEHLTTNYATMNYWHSKGVSYTYVSSEITLNEIENIGIETSMKLIVPIFGYLPMFVSKRNLINNYKKYFDIEDDSKYYTLYKEGRFYPIDNTHLGTVVYSSSILNGLSELKRFEKINVAYVTLNSYRIPDDKFIEIAKLFYNREYHSESVIEEMFPNTDKGFLYKETVYRVKKNEEK